MKVQLTIAALAAALLVPATAAAAPLPQEQGRVDLRTQANVSIVGARPWDNAGNDVAPAGDVNGDGVDDVVIGARTADAGDRPDAGAAYVVFGRPSIVRYRRQALDDRGFRIVGPSEGATAGYAVAGAGDVNGDGLDDVLVGAPGLLAPFPADRSSAYIVYGKRGGGTVDLAAPGTAAMRIDGPRPFGSSVAGGRDVTGDGRPDVVIGVGAGAYAPPALVRGGALPDRLQAEDLGAHGFLMGDLGGDPTLVADMNGDRRAEVTSGVAPSTEPVLARVAFGRPTAKPAGGFDVVSDVPLSPLGGGLAGGGDVNGDGRGDLVLGNPSATFRGAHGQDETTGAAYVVFGSRSTATVRMTGRPTRRVLVLRGARTTGPLDHGETPQAGADVAVVPDVNGDRRDDVLVGAASASPLGRTNAGAAYVAFGRGHGLVRLGSMTRRQGFSLAGPRVGDHVGAAVAPAGDFNDDGRPDLVVGARSGHRELDRYGVAYVLYGFGGAR